MLLGLEYQQWLVFSVVAAVISTFGSILGLSLKEYFFARSFESWKQRKSLEKIYEKYKDPLSLAARELCFRLSEILRHYPTVYLNSSVLESDPKKQINNSIDDPYFQKYKFLSTSYRVCALFGWIELYRQEMVFLNSGRGKHNKSLERCIESIRGDIADGQLNHADNWRDRLIFREELREIGEIMLEESLDTKNVVGYARFCELLESNTDTNLKKWVATVDNFLLDLEDSGMDFRKVRLERLVVHLVDLLELLDDDSPSDQLLKLRNKYRSAVS